MLKLLLLTTILSTNACATQPVAFASHPDCINQAGNEARAMHLVEPTDHVSVDQQMDISIHLMPRNEAALDQRIKDMYTPGHKLEGKYLTPEAYRLAHGPTRDDVHAVTDHLRAYGMRITGRAGHVIRATGQVGHVERAFDTRISHFTSAKGPTSWGPSIKPSVPKHLPRMVIDGLSQKSAKVTHAHRVPHTELAHRRQAPLSAKVVRSAYNVPDAATGKGQRIAMLELDGYESADLDHYAAEQGIRRVPTRNVLVNGYDGQVADQDARVEVTMDIELAMAMAPGLDEIVVYEAANDDTGLSDILNRLANPINKEPLIKIASLSWGEPERDLSSSDVIAEYNLFRQLAAQGQTVFVASGDSGAKDDGHHLGTDDPASQPFAMAVGGTTLKVVNGLWQGESAWKNGGGGISCFWKAPSWQAGLDSPSAKGSLTLRDVPDVSLNADPATGYDVFVGNWMIVGGTSCAAPLWAAFAGLVNEKRANVSKPPLGFWGPLFYRAAQTPAGQLGLHDISDNSTNGYYPAIKGLDEATGWGTIIGGPLLDALGAL